MWQNLPIPEVVSDDPETTARCERLERAARAQQMAALFDGDLDLY